jgi:Protein of unknown function (DUF4236)
MGHWRFRRSIGSKFLKLNISKTGFSITGGVPGAHVNVPLAGKRKRRAMSTFSLPGTGLSYRQPIGGPVGRTTSGGSTDTIGTVISAVILIIIVASVIHWFVG